MNLNPNSQLAILFGSIAVALGVWFFTALRTGKALFISHTSIPRMVDRQTDTIAFWSMTACVGVLFIVLAATAAGEWISS